jgi:hypothetical protein
VRPVLPASPTAEQRARLGGPPMLPDSIGGMAFNLAAEQRLEQLPNIPAFRASGQAAAAGVGSARGLARLYAMCGDEVDGFPRLLTDATIAQFGQIQAVGPDLVLRLPTCFAIVFQKADARAPYGSHQAYGHDGAGGSIGIADPWHGIAWAWIPRRMTFPGGADSRGLELAAALRDCL